MKYVLNFCLFLVMCTIGTSCFKERIELDLNDGQNKRVVVTAWITNLDEQQTVLLNYTSDYFDSLNIEYINDAEVKLMYDSIELVLTPADNGVYHMPLEWRGEEGTSYTLEIEHNGKSYTATNIMRPMPKIENVYSELSEERLEEDSIVAYEIYFSFKDLPNEGDGYYGIDFRKNTLEGDTMLRGEFINDEFIDGEFFEDVSITNRDYSIGDTVILELNSIGKEVSKYLQDILDESFRDGLFDPTPVNVRSNFTNGALGYFITSGSRRVEIIVE